MPEDASSAAVKVMKSAIRFDCLIVYHKKTRKGLLLQFDAFNILSYNWAIWQSTASNSEPMLSIRNIYNKFRTICLG